MSAIKNKKKWSDDFLLTQNTRFVGVFITVLDPGVSVSLISAIQAKSE